jgi:hypothetical protein
VDANGVEALDKLFKEIGPKFAKRNGGYFGRYDSSTSLALARATMPKSKNLYSS